MAKRFCTTCGTVGGSGSDVPCAACLTSDGVRVVPNRRDRRRQKHRPKEQLAAPWSIAPNTKIFP